MLGAAGQTVQLHALFEADGHAALARQVDQFLDALPMAAARYVNAFEGASGS
jgi:hypothetical protein